MHERDFASDFIPFVTFSHLNQHSKFNHFNLQVFILQLFTMKAFVLPPFLQYVFSHLIIRFLIKEISVIGLKFMLQSYLLIFLKF